MNKCAFPYQPNDESVSKRHKEQQRIDAEIKTALNEYEDRPERRAALESLLACVRLRTQLLRPAPGQGRVGWAGPVFLLNRLKNLAARQGLWLRPPDTWQPVTTNLRPAFRSLAQHLLARYPVPGFMDSVWDLPAGPEAFRQQAWYIRLGRGASVRELNLPLLLTRNMAHWVRLAPDHYTVFQALRYGEIRGLGGSEELGREIVLGRLGRSIEHPEFWRTVLLFFVRHPEMPIEHANPMVDFGQENKYGGEDVLTEHGAERRVPPWPGFSMEGRTLKSMMRLVSAWHLELAGKKKGCKLTWRKSPIQEYRYLEKRPEEETDRLWSIQQLLDSEALYAEGRAMRHCVCTYANLCWRGETTIWSLRLRVNDTEKRMATIEVDPRQRAIIQVRAKCNQRPGGRSLEIMRQWAAWAGIQLKA